MGNPAAIPWVVGHRGASGTAPENTLASFQKAIDAGARMCELDLHLTKDGIPVVIHDERVDRTTNGVGSVADWTLAELKHLDAGMWFHKDFRGQRIPTLREVLRLARGKLNLFLELKTNKTDYPGIEEAVLDEVREEGMAEEVIVGSFNSQTIVRAKGFARGVSVGGILEDLRQLDALLAATGGVDVLSARHVWATEATTRPVHERRLPLFLWTVNEEDEMRRCSALGPVGLMSDYPEVLARVLSEGGAPGVPGVA